MNDTHYYKVVSIKRKNKKVIRTSFLNWRLNTAESTNPAPFKLAVAYVPGKVTKPKIAGTKLMVFGNLYAAAIFAASNDKLQIWECTVTNPVKMEVVNDFYCMNGNESVDEVADIWKLLLCFETMMPGASHYDPYGELKAKCNVTRDLKCFSMRDAPSSTFACDTVTLTKQVRSYESRNRT